MVDETVKCISQIEEVLWTLTLEPITVQDLIVTQIHG